MTNEVTTIMDYIDNIAVKGNPFAEPTNEYYALLCLRTGLDFLYRQAEKCEQAAIKQIDPKKRFVGIGNLGLLPEPTMRLLACAFQWYSVSACQYVGTVGTIAHFQDNSQPIPPVYIKSVIPEVLAYRDKVGAHYAWSKNSTKDNEAERLASIIPQVGWSKDSFQVQVFTVSEVIGGIPSNSKVMKPWSITEIHKRLRERYWPEEIEP